MFFQKLRRRKCHPLIKGYICKMIAFEHFQKAECCIPCVLHIMSHRKRYIAYITGLVIECPCMSFSSKYSHFPLSLNVILPFICIWMPMHFPYSARLYFNKYCSNCFGSFKISRVSNPCFTTTRFHWLLIFDAETKWIWYLPICIFDFFLCNRTWYLSLIDILFS